MMADEGMHMSRWRKWGIWLVVVLIIVAAVAYYYRQSHVIEVETVAVKQGELVVTVTPTETGTVGSDATAQITAELAARVALARSGGGAARGRRGAARGARPRGGARARAARAGARARGGGAK